MTKDQIQLMNSLDPARRQLAFKGFGDAPISARVAYLETLFQDNRIQFKNIDHIYSGPKGNRKLSGILLIEFSLKQVATNILLTLRGKGKELSFSDQYQITLKPAITTINLKRNHRLREAHEMIKEQAQSKSAEVKIDFKKREITVNGSTVFSQSFTQLSSTFHGPYTNLCFP